MVITSIMSALLLFDNNLLCAVIVSIFKIIIKQQQINDLYSAHRKKMVDVCSKQIVHIV